MKLRILEQDLLQVYPHYRGFTRAQPFYVDTVSDEHRANQLFFRSLELDDDLGFFDDLEFCKELVETYQNLEPPHYFDIVEVTQEDAPPSLKDVKFLGFDVVWSYNQTIIVPSIEREIKTENVPSTDLIWTLLPIFKLIKSYFGPRLNRNKLFDDYQTAQFYMEVAIAVQKIRPDIYENDDQFKVFGIWKVQTEGSQ